MKAACFVDVGVVETRQISNPIIESDSDVIIKTKLAGLCGSDLHPFWGREKGLEPGTVMGHEVVGEVVEIGNAIKNFSVGDQVFAPFSTSCGACFYCQQGIHSRCESNQLFGWISEGKGLHGCQSEYVRIPLADGTLVKQPNGLSDVAALLLGDNFSTGYFCAEMAEIKPHGCYAVVGCGTVGLMCILAAKSMKADTIFAIDPVADRRTEAENLGAIALDPSEAAAQVLDHTQGRGVDSVMELVGIPDAQKLAFDLIRSGGIMSVIGCHCTPNFAFSPVDAYDKNLTYKTGRCPARFYMEHLTEVVASGKFQLDPFVTHRFPIAECKLAYDTFSNRKDGCLKAVFEF